MPTTPTEMGAYSRYLEAMGQAPAGESARWFDSFKPEGFSGMGPTEFAAILRAMNYQPAALQAQTGPQPYQAQGGLNDALAAIRARMQNQQMGGAQMQAPQAGGARTGGMGFGPLDRFQQRSMSAPLYQGGPPVPPQFGAAPWLRGGGLLTRGR